MKVKYFADTDTALLEFSDALVEETREIAADVYADFDRDGNVVSITIDRASSLAQLPHISVESLP